MEKHPGKLLLAAAAILCAALPGTAQAAPRTGAPALPALDAAFTYGGTLSGAISSTSFWMQGGSAQIHGRFYGGWGAVADVSGMHIADINSTGVGLDMVTATFGPRYTWSPAPARYELFGQGLVGVANGFHGVFPNPAGVQSVANSLAVKAGGGLNFNLTPHLAVRGCEIDYLRTQVPNATNNGQNNLQINAGLVLRFR
jgi:hypothetical protein